MDTSYFTIAKNFYDSLEQHGLDNADGFARALSFILEQVELRRENKCDPCLSLLIPETTSTKYEGARGCFEFPELSADACMTALSRNADSQKKLVVTGIYQLTVNNQQLRYPSHQITDYLNHMGLPRTHYGSTLSKLRNDGLIEKVELAPQLSGTKACYRLTKRGFELAQQLTAID